MSAAVRSTVIERRLLDFAWSKTERAGLQNTAPAPDDQWILRRTPSTTSQALAAGLSTCESRNFAGTFPVMCNTVHTDETRLQVLPGRVYAMFTKLLSGRRLRGYQPD